MLPLLAIGPLVAGCGERPWRVHHAPHFGGRAEGLAHLPLRVAPDLVIKRVQFGVLATGEDGEDRFTPANEVPAEDGQVFGWVAEVETSRPSLRWQEHLRLPKPPADWGDVASDPDIVLSDDGKSALAEGEDLVDGGELQRFYWSLASGDPAGSYELDLAIEGRPVAHFVFRVPTTVREKAILVRHGLRAPRAQAPVQLVPVATAPGARTWR